MKNGFTLLEVLIAVFMVVLVAFTAGTSLITVLSGEQVLLRQQAATRWVLDTTTRQFMERTISNTFHAAGANWNVEQDEVEMMDHDHAITWTTWTLNRENGGIAPVRLSFRKR